MTAEQWTVLGIIVAIITFLFLGPSFANKGWEKRKAGQGNFQFYVGIALSVLSIVCIIVLIYLLKNGYLIDDGGDGGKNLSEVSSMSTESLGSEAGNIYVSNCLYEGATYSGYVNELRQPDGKGKMKYSDGCLYDGDWVDGVREGQGRMEYANGVYEGQWKNDRKNGVGTYTWSDGKKYEGAYEDDIRCGKGTFTGWVDLTNGYVGTYVGESQNDMFEGQGFFFFDNGDKFEGIYKENLYWIGVYTKKDGSSYEVINGKPKNE